MNDSLSATERERELARLRDSTGGYAQVAAGIVQLVEPSLGDYVPAKIEPAPPPPPPPSQAYLDALEKERRRDAHLAEVRRRLDDVLAGSEFHNRNPFEHLAVQSLASNPDTVRAREIAEQLFQEGDLPGAEFEAALSLIAEREAADADFEMFCEAHRKESHDRSKPDNFAP